MLYREKLLFLILILIFSYSCANEKEKAYKSLKKTIEQYNKKRKELDNFYITNNKSKKLTNDTAVLSTYYTMMISLNNFTWQNAENVNKWKKILYNSDMLKRYRIPKPFIRREDEYKKIHLELNMRLSILIPRMRKTKHAPGEARASLTGAGLDSNVNYYDKGAKNLRTGDKKIINSDLKRGPRESAPVYDVHKKYFN